MVSCPVSSPKSSCNELLYFTQGCAVSTEAIAKEAAAAAPLESLNLKSELASQVQHAIGSAAHPQGIEKSYGDSEVRVLNNSCHNS
jgi:hypothetical protein